MMFGRHEHRYHPTTPQLFHVLLFGAGESCPRSHNLEDVSGPQDSQTPPKRALVREGFVSR